MELAMRCGLLTKELPGICVDRVVLHIATAMAPHPARVDGAVGTNHTVAFDIPVDGIGQRAWHTRRQRNLIDAVAIALEQFPEFRRGKVRLRVRVARVVGQLHHGRQDIESALIVK